MDKKEKQALGKRSRKMGKDFEVRVRRDLEASGWVVNRWSNDIDFDGDKLKPSKPKYFFDAKTGKMKMMGFQDGFPDFVCFKRINGNNKARENLYDVIGVESKISGKLDKLEKEKCSWLLRNEVFSCILFTKRVKVGRRVCVKYFEFGVE